MKNYHQYLKDVITLQYYPELCNGCGLCVDVCPHQVFTMQNKRAVVVNRDRCIECGACQLNCQRHALTVRAGVGCATAVLTGYFKKSEPSCGCSGSGASCN